ncbi:MAG: TIGR03087 family PEP-CTERM/XrtA system glycosyltransferase [Deltaproteobacteria bacterium]
MKILYVCHRFPYPPKRGGKIRPFNMIRHLTEQGHQVTVASLVRSDEEAEEGRGLADHCHEYIMERVHDPLRTASMIRRLPTMGPSSMGYFHSRKLKARITEKVADVGFDLIFVHCSSVAQYVEDVGGVPKILDFGDMDSQKWLSYGQFKPFPLNLGYYLEGLKMQLAEVELAKKFDTCTATTRAELATLDGFNTGVRTGWFPNGVDANKFSPSDEPYDRDTVCFIGRMDYYPNQECMFDFTANVLPLIQRRRPGTKLLIVGADPSPAIQDLGKLPGVTVTGSVPQVQPYVTSAALTVAPLNIARGTQNKILEALAMGVPTVCSTLAAGGVDCVPGEHILTANRPEEYADAVLRLLNDESERKRFAEAGRKRVLSHHDWGASMKRLDKIIDDTVEGYRRLGRTA